MKKKSKPDFHKAWKDNRNEKFDQSKKGFKPSHLQNQQRNPSQAVTKPTRMMGDKPRDPKDTKEPLQCWGCGGNHMHRNCPHGNGNVSQVHNIQGAKTAVQMERDIPRIYAALKDCQADHQSTVVDVEGKIVEQSISILIDPRSTHSYITPRIAQIFSFKKLKHSKSWLVQLATGTKRKVSEIIEKCPLYTDGLFTYANLNIMPLGSYDILIGMDWLEAHKVKLDYYNKTFECMDEEGNPRVVRDIPRVIFVRQVSAI